MRRAVTDRRRECRKAKSTHATENCKLIEACFPRAGRGTLTTAQERLVLREEIKARRRKQKHSLEVVGTAPGQNSALNPRPEKWPRGKGRKGSP